MSSVSAIEFGVHSCVIARVSVRGGTTQVSHVYGLRAEEPSLPDSDRTDYLRDVRRQHGFPRHARVVAWGLPDGVSATDPATKLALAPLLQAGFVLDAVMSPTEALAMLARQRPRPVGCAGAAWLSLNKHAAAIAIVDNGELLFSRVFDWNYRPAASLREELLQRYLLVAHLAPELRHGFEVVGAERGATIDAIITCGDLPDLRSLTMPLIEELDMEVETLDSLDGLQIAARAQAEEIADKAPALHLASAAAADGGTATTRRGPARLLLAAAAAIAILGTAIWAVTQFVGSSRTAPQIITPSAQPANEVARTSPAPPKAIESAPAPSSPAAPAHPPDRGHDGADPNVPAATTGRTPVPSVRGGVETSARPPEQRRPGSMRAPLSPPPQNISPSGRSRGAASTGAAKTQERRLVPLDAPLPTVNSILVSPERRLAVVDGLIVHEGDAIGPRVVFRIEPDAVVLKEPSGYEVRVPIRRRIEPATEL
jgi:hypothetical protein